MKISNHFLSSEFFYVQVSCGKSMLNKSSDADRFTSCLMYWKEKKKKKGKRGCWVRTKNKHEEKQQGQTHSVVRTENEKWMTLKSFDFWIQWIVWNLTLLIPQKIFFFSFIVDLFSIIELKLNSASNLSFVRNFKTSIFWRKFLEVVNYHQSDLWSNASVHLFRYW